MSLRDFIRQTQMLIQHGLHMTRDCGFAGSERPLELARLEERILFSASAIAPIAAEVAEAGAALMESAASLTSPTPSTNPDSGLFQLSDQQFLDLMADTVLAGVQTPSGSAAAESPEDHTLELVFLDGSLDNLDQMKADLIKANAADSSRTLEFV
ncbi:MAG: hypothetical protein ACK58L_01540, partial [Planctomycetota bacterium]